MPAHRPRLPARHRAPRAGEWLPLPILLTLVAGMLVFGVFQMYGIDAAVVAIVALGLAGGIAWQRLLGAPTRRRRPRARTPARRRATPTRRA